ncbi:uncharacterized protein AMSG_01890 [Thecamonas trahens ATCC 50062]|uniref:Uncharacterized protein n=1 Tax=Thecamonas trahens ATCC 50062 TaxID=461836 RepID=A0A0L0DUA9_THETB|nr:hypothetical protein AMSG_01890 [Thecamonas trahens ATCC 50062]KNC55621.1 hypothetical protein AMSG_01890 [Thecamonas trahens ATCC 50062]|eukprot:XP_013761394.1 hypothetical protein AMSG_01890 [Thecamonas trahens ATCC 50062]
MAFVRRAAASAVPAVRMMSGSAAEAAHHASAWKMYSKGGLAALGVVTAYVAMRHFSHDHHHSDAPLYAFQERRKRAFPWGDASLFGQDKREGKY